MSTNCLTCKNKDIEYIQIEDTLLSFALCKECYEKKKSDKQKYKKKEEFLKRYEAEISKQFPNVSKCLSFKQSTDKLLQWKNIIKPLINDALYFIKNNNYTQQNFQNLGTFFLKRGKEMENQATYLVNFLNAQNENLLDPRQFQEQNQNEILSKKFLEFLKEINPKFKENIYQEMVKEIQNEIKTIFSAVPQQFQKIGMCFKNDEQDQNKYIGYINLIEFKDGKGIFKNNNILYYGIFDCDVFKYGVKFEFISQTECQFFFGSFFKDEITGKGKMLAYQIQKENNKEIIVNQIYEGEYENGLRNGEGEFRWNKNDKKITFKGFWKNNLQHGKGVLDDNVQKKNVEYDQGKLKQDDKPFNQGQINQNPSTQVFQFPTSKIPQQQYKWQQFEQSQKLEQSQQLQKQQQPQIFAQTQLKTNNVDQSIKLNPEFIQRLTPQQMNQFDSFQQKQSQIIKANDNQTINKKENNNFNPQPPQVPSGNQFQQQIQNQINFPIQQTPQKFNFAQTNNINQQSTNIQLNDNQFQNQKLINFRITSVQTSFPQQKNDSASIRQTIDGSITNSQSFRFQ